MNGTSKDRLGEQYLEASNAVRVALKQLGESAPNARDYYPQGDQAFSRARKEHIARLEKLTSVRQELEEILESILG